MQAKYSAKNTATNTGLQATFASICRPWVALGAPLAAIATLAIGSSLPAAAETAVDIPVQAAATEIDSSLTRDYTSAVIYLPTGQDQRLEAHSAVVAADQPVEGAVSQIVGAYEGQDVGIQSYAVDVDPVAHDAAIDFKVESPRGPRALQSLSSANQYALLEAIRETLLTEPVYDVDEVIFKANGQEIDI